MKTAWTRAYTRASDGSVARADDDNVVMCAIRCDFGLIDLSVTTISQLFALVHENKSAVGRISEPRLRTIRRRRHNSQSRSTSRAKHAANKNTVQKRVVYIYVYSLMKFVYPFSKEHSVSVTSGNVYVLSTF